MFTLVGGSGLRGLGGVQIPLPGVSLSDTLDYCTPPAMNGYRAFEPDWTEVLQCRC